MKRKASHYPISQLIARVFEDSKLPPAKFILALGYRNASKGIRRLDEWLKEGEGTPVLIDGLRDVFGIAETAIQQALNATAALKKREAAEQEERDEEYRRLHFEPYIFVETFETVPKQICFFAILGGAPKFIRLSPAFLSLERERAIRIVSWLVRRHYKQTDGKCITFGTISGYRFVRTFEESVLIDTEGRVRGVEEERFRPGFMCELRFKGGASRRRQF